MLTQIRGGEENNFEKDQEGPVQEPGNGDRKLEPGNGHTNGEGVVDADEATKKLAEEFPYFGGR